MELSEKRRRKSTFCRSVCGLHPLSTGSIQIEGGYTSEKERRNLSYIVMQDVNHQLFGDSVMEEMTISQDHPDMEKANALLREFALEDYKDHHPLALSGGQKQRLAIAVSLMLHKQIYLFDEPSSGLDYQSCAPYVTRLQNYRIMAAPFFLSLMIWSYLILYVIGVYFLKKTKLLNCFLIGET